jgi:hypothetical protein
MWSNNLGKKISFIMLNSFMKIKTIPAGIFLFILLNNTVFSQNKVEYKWFNPVQNELPVIEGRGWNDQLESVYDRFPERAKKLVREPVWNLSKHSAGLSIRFKTNSDDIVVRYKVINNEYAMSHMPATGVSGVDLFAKNNDGMRIWLKGRYSFGDTITYHFKDIIPRKGNKNDLEYRLYLPLYNAVEWLEIGVPAEVSFKFLPLCKKKPVVVYGTSIAQGGCASRPGMAWTSILGRGLDRPVINLGFSGNGLLDKEVIDLITEIDAEVYVLDCLPNLVLNKERTSEVVYQRIISSVKEIRKKHPDTPVLLVDHAGYGDGMSDNKRFKAFTDLNRINHKAYNDLKAAGVLHLFILSNAELDLDQQSFVDGTHPTDHGMIQYAQAYKSIIRKIISDQKHR